MVHYIQRERNLDSSIPSGSIIKFDTPITLSETSSLTPPADFIYQDDGSIDIMRPGTYMAYWYVVNMPGPSTIGQSYQLKQLDYSRATPDWDLVAGTSNHIKVSQTPGFAILDISQEEIDEHEKATVAVFNTSDDSVETTIFIPKAGILIFGLSAESLENRLVGIDGQT